MISCCSLARPALCYCDGELTTVDGPEASASASLRPLAVVASGEAVCLVFSVVLLRSSGPDRFS